MDQARWNRIEEILQGALDLDPGQRAAFLRSACGTDAGLQREVLALLASSADGILLETPAIARMSALVDRPYTGQQISHYRIEARIGIGGMAEVYRAHDERLRRTVALKALPAEFLSDAGRLHRFEQEAFAASRLNHPNIITIFETLQADGTHFIATEHVEGQTLRDMLTDPQTGKPRKLPVDVALDITMQIATALKAAHVAWIIHRDIKPENVMVRADGLVKVLDFGIAKLSEETPDPGVTETEAGLDSPSSSTLTIPGAVLGTASYMSPEQARGAPLDGRTDIFSLGVVLYEMIAGERMFAGGTRAELLTAADHGQELLPSRTALDAVPKDLERVLRKMLRINREQRYASAGELIEELQKVKRRIDGRRARRLVGVSGLTALMAVTLSAIAALLSVSEVWDERVMRDGHTAAARQAVFSPDGRLLASCGEDGRVIVWDFARRQRLATLNVPSYRVAFAPDGRSFVTGGTDGTITVWDPASWRITRTLKEQPSEVLALAFSPDAALMASATIRKIVLWDARRAAKIREWPSGFSYGNLLFTGNGRQLVSSSAFGSVDLPDGRVTPAYAGNAIAVSPDGTRIATMDTTGDVSFYRAGPPGGVAAPELIVRRRAHQDHGRSLAYSPDGRLLASAAEDIIVWDALKQEKIARLEYSSIVWSVEFSPDGRWLISAHGDGAVLIWDVAERALAGSLNEHSGAVRAAAFVPHAPNGLLLASGGEDRTVIVWDVGRGRKQRVLTGHQTRVTAVAVSPNGKRLASADQDGVVIVWDVSTGQALLAIRSTESGADYCLALSPDGRFAASTHGVYRTSDAGILLKPHLTYGVVYGVAISGDGRYVATVTDHGWIILWDVGRRRLVEAVHLPDTHQICVSLSPDGKWLATGEDEGRVRLWSASPLREVAILGRHTARVKSVAFAPDGLEVASAGDDRMIALWDVRKRALRTRVGTHTSPVYAIAFSPDGRQLASGEHDRSVRVYTRHRSLWGFRLE